MAGIVKFGATPNYNDSAQRQRIGNDDVYGPGINGDVVITGNPITLTSDMYYNNLTINSGAFLLTNGYRVFVKNTLTINGAIGLGTFTASVVGELSSDIGTNSISGIETASTAIVYSVGGKGGGGIGTPSATQLPESYRNHIDSLIASAVVTPDGVVVIKGGAKGTTGSQGTTYPALTNADTWPGKAGSVGANGSGAGAGGAGAAGSGATAGGAGAAGSAGSGATAGGLTGPQVIGHQYQEAQNLHLNYFVVGNGYGAAGTGGHNGSAGAAGTHGTAGTNGAAGTHGTPGTNGVGSTGSLGTATGATPGTGGAGGTAGSGGGLVLIVARNITGSGKVISLGRSGSTGSAGTTGLGGTPGATGTGATNGAAGTAGTGATNGAAGVAGTGATAGTAGTAGSAGDGYHHPAHVAHHYRPTTHTSYRMHSHTAGAENGPSTYHAGHPHAGHGHGHNSHRFTNGDYHTAHPHMQDHTHTEAHRLSNAQRQLQYNGTVHGHGSYRKYQPHVTLSSDHHHTTNHQPGQHSAGGAAGAAGTAGTPGTNGAAGSAGTPGTNGAAGGAGSHGTNGAGGLAAPSSGTGGTGKRGGAGGGGGIIVITETTPSSVTYDTRAGLTSDIDTYAADSGYSYVILNQ